MNEKRVEQSGEDRVEQAAEALREECIPAGPSEALIQRTLMRAGAGEVSNVFVGKGWMSMRSVRRSAVAAALVLVIGGGAVVGLLGRGAQVGFAQVVEQVRAVHAVRCKLTVELAHPPAGSMPQDTEVLMVDSGWTITKTTGMTMIVSQEKHTMLMLMEGQKQAVVVDMKNIPANAPKQPNLLEEFRSVDEKTSKPLGEKELDGKKVKGFAAERKGMLMNVWADVETKLPVRVEMTMENPLMPQGQFVFTGFEWDPKFDARLLSLEIPEGYQVTNSAMDVSKPSEGDVVAMLKVLAEMNDGVFPEGIGMEAFTKVLAQKMAVRQGAETAGMTPEQTKEWWGKQMNTMMQQAAPVGRGWTFISQGKAGTKWFYAKGALLGKKGTPVLWYKPADKATWRVFDADLTVHDAAEGDLPKGEAVELKLSGPLNAVQLLGK